MVTRCRKILSGAVIYYCTKTDLVAPFGSFELKAVYRWFGFALMLTANVFFIYYCIENWVSIPKYLLDLQVLSRLVAASFFYIFIFIFTAIAWQIMLNAVGANSRLSQILTIILISQFAKYIPGNIGHHLGRVDVIPPLLTEVISRGLRHLQQLSWWDAAIQFGCVNFAGFKIYTQRGHLSAYRFTGNRLKCF